MTNKTNPFSLVLLEKQHDRKNFDCGSEPLNTYIKQYALQNQKRNMTRVYVILLENKVVAYYSLVYGGVSPEEMPQEMRVGQYQIPIMLIGRMGVDVTQKGKGLGHAMLQDAAIRTIQAADIAGLRALFVHAKDLAAKAFYEHHGFIVCPSDPLHLFFPVDIMRKTPQS
ncbi:MAG: GNAT family N-acetyltransferase [Blastocatellia bacterium]|jgi:GNAT superfamily N-acetyltransferase|nr:GNAT family N-acetyltransferase [Blastocatellia bacterium]